MTDEKTDSANVAEKPPQNAAIIGSPALPQDELNKLTDDIIAGLKTVYDPEIPADIYEIGLIYKIDVSDISIFTARSSPMSILYINPIS